MLDGRILSTFCPVPSMFLACSLHRDTNTDTACISRKTGPLLSWSLLFPLMSSYPVFSLGFCRYPQDREEMSVFVCFSSSEREGESGSEIEEKTEKHLQEAGTHCSLLQISSANLLIPKTVPD